MKTLLVAAVFLCGALYVSAPVCCGAVPDLEQLAEKMTLGPVPRPDTTTLMEELSKAIQLDLSQEKEIKGLLEAAGKEYDSISAERVGDADELEKQRAEMKRIEKAARELVNGIPEVIKSNLTPDQVQSYESILEGGKAEELKPQAVKEAPASAPQAQTAPEQKTDLQQKPDLKTKKAKSAAAGPAVSEPAGRRQVEEVNDFGQ